ncbi:MAG: dihydroorotate dehydrogenase electron transfer subunit [Chloroflexi bacterium]|nr:dihydroorotate dehydrogenase electron transfer subunit [Chloroflexota bacterium]
MTLPQTVIITSVRDEAHNIRSITLDAAAPDAQPGQFIMVWLPGNDEKPMSITSPAPLTFTVARVGPFTTDLHQRKVGDYIGWRGPYGRGFALDQHRPALLVAGGCGVGPIYFLACVAQELGVPTTVALGARSDVVMPLQDAFRELAPSVELVLATDDGSLGHQGFITEVVRQHVVRERGIPPAIYACGPEGMLVTLHRMCVEMDLPGQFSLERYMKCGIGICGQCAVDGLLVCKDGPVFDVAQLDSVADFGRFRHSATGRRIPIR